MPLFPLVLLTDTVLSTIPPSYCLISIGCMSFHIILQLTYTVYPNGIIHYCPSVLQSYILQLSLRPTVLLSLCHTVLLSLCHTVLLSLCHTVLLSLCHTVLLSLRHTVLLSLCLTVLLSLRHTVLLSLCLTVLLA